MNISLIMNSKTLIIHPSDYSTDFLKPIYAGLSEATVVTQGTKDEVEQLIEQHDQVIMLGHGSPWGLFSVGKFKTDNGYVIDNSLVHLLSQKQNNIYIWCNADKFVLRHQLKGFYSGMFISEVSEANYCGLPGTLQSVVDESNNYFATKLGEVLGKGSLRETYKHIKDSYRQLSESNSIAQYNNERLYLTEGA